MNAMTEPVGPEGELETLRRRVGELEAEVACLRQAAEAPGQSEAAVRALVESEVTFRQLVETAADIIYAVDRQRRITYVSPSVKPILGYDPQELVGRGAAEFNDLTDPQRSEAHFEKVISGEPATDERQVRAKSGELRWVRVAARPIVADGAVVGLRGVISDITEMRETETALRRSELLYRTTIDEMGDFVHVVDRDLRVQLLNRQFARWCDRLGLAADGVGQDIYDLFPFLPDTVRAEYDRVFETGRILVTEERTVVGDQTVITETRKIPVLEDGRTVRVITAIRDITERRQAEEALRLHGQIIENMAEGVTLVRASDGAIVYANATFERLFGYDPGELTGRHVTVLNGASSRSPDETAGEIMGVVAERGVWRGQVHNVRKDGTEFWSHANVSAFSHGEHGEVLLTVQQDITERVRSDRALRESEENYRAVVEGAGEAIFTMDADGVYQFVNGVGAERVGRTPDEVVGKTMWDLFPREVADRQVGLVRQVIDSGEGLVSETQTVIREQPRWYRMSIQPLRDDEGKVTAALAIAADITEHREAQQALRKSQETERRFREQLARLHEATLELSEAESFDDLCRRAVELGTGKFAFGRMGLWFVTDEPGVVRGSFGTDRSGNVIDERNERNRLPPKSPASRVLAERTRVGVTGEFRALDEDGQAVTHAAQALASLWDGHQITGFVSIDNLLTGKPMTEYDRELLALYASTVGHLCARFRIEDEIRRREAAERGLREQLAVLHEVTVELSQAETFDDLCRQAVELGLSRLGFDRLGLWFVTGEPGMVAGTFGTDEEGHIRDERDLLIDAGPRPWAVDLLTGKQTRAIVLSDVAAATAAGDVVAAVTRGAAPLTDGRHTLGYISADNLLTHRPWTDDQTELLDLYASTIGHLATRIRAEDEIRRREADERSFREQLGVLHELTIELSRSGTFDDLCRQAVELGRQRLGIDRMGLWFVTDTEGDVAGSFGTDEEGNTRDERGDLVIVGPSSAMGQILADRTRSVVVREMALRDAQANIVGRGASVQASLWDGERIIGWLSSDNLLTGRPITEAQVEVIALFASAVGHLCSRMRVQEALRESEQRMRLILENSTDAIMITEMDPTTGRRRLVMCNDRYAEMAGRGREELMAADDLNELVRAYRENADKADRQGAPREPDAPDRGVSSWIRPDGKENYFEWTAAPMEMGGRRYHVGIDRDVTERHQAQQDLRESEERYRMLVETMNEGLGQLDADGNIIYANDQLCTLLGRSREDLVGRSVVDLVDEDAREAFGKRIARRRRGDRRSYEMVWTTPAGHRRPTLVSPRPMFDDRGRYRGSFAVFADISELVAAQEALQESRDRLQYVIDNTSDILFEIDLAGNYTLGNPVARKVTGYSLKKLLTMNLRDLTVPEHHKMLADRLRRRVRGEELEQPFTFEIIHRRGHRVTLETNTTGVYVGGDLIGVQGIARDVTERVRAEQALREARARLTGAREEERRRLAGELHDSVGQGLIAIQLGLGGLISRADRLEELDPAMAETVDALFDQTGALLRRSAGRFTAYTRRRWSRWGWRRR